jgi:hypothetical protein
VVTGSSVIVAFHPGYKYVAFPARSSHEVRIFFNLDFLNNIITKGRNCKCV